MRASAILASVVAVAGTASAVPTGADIDELLARDDVDLALNAHAIRQGLGPRDGQAADATLAWVSVDDEGQPVETHTPSITTESGTTSVVDGAPHDLTASVYTLTSYALVTTSTGDPPNPTATHSGGEGAFSRCYNPDGEYAPFCRPSHNTTIFTGNTYYVTWDPDYYNKSSSGNTTYEVSVRVDYLNQTTNDWLKLETFDKVPAAWGFWPFQVENKHMKGHHTINNITITLISSPKGSNEKTNSVALPAAIGKPTLPSPTPTPKPGHRDLIIALPVVLGTMALLIFGVCVWNRKARRIHLPDALSRRRRNGYTGRSTRRGLHKDEGIQLTSRLHRDPPVPDYTDDLGSLAGSPVDELFSQQREAAARSNAFRDEIARQTKKMEDDDKFL